MRSALSRLLAAFALAGLPAVAIAQDPTVVTGTVTAEGGEPIQGVSVGIPQLGAGTITAADGRYSFTVPATQASGQHRLVARRIGYQPYTATITLAPGTVTHDVTLARAVTELEAMVTTALGIEKSKKSVGVAQQQVDSSLLTRTRDVNLAATLSGKVAGLNVTPASTQGGSARIVIRGAGSIGGNNQPLFIVDGVPVDNSNFAPATTQRGYGGFDYGSAIQDINPDDIASVSVLKGPNAAALYGSRAANGAIIITTKSGRNANRFEVTASSNLTWETPLRLPDYQNTWGQGLGGNLCDTLATTLGPNYKQTPQYQTCGFSYVDGNYGGVNDGVDESWGPRLDGTPRSQHSFTEAGAAEVRPFVPQPNNVRDFFELGQSHVLNVAAQGSNDRANFRVSLTNQDVQGMVPNNALKRFTGSLAAGADVNDRLTVNGNLQYVRNEGLNRPGTGYDASNPMMGFVWSARQTDVRRLKNHYIDAEGRQINWNYSYHNNPYWAQYVNSNFDERNRVIGQVQANYKFTDWLTGMVRTGTDFYRDFRTHRIAAGWIGGFFDGDYSQGGFQESNRFNQETNTDFLLTATRSVTPALGIKVDVGGNRRVNNYRMSAFGTDQLVIPGTYNIGNSAIPVIPTEWEQRKQINSLYGQAEFSWNDWLFLNVTGRNDWSSTLPAGNNSYFYPSVSTSWVFSEALPQFTAGGVLSYGKLRGGWSRVGNDADPYQLQLTYPALTPFGGVPIYGVPNTLPNADLKPEETVAWEIGTELQFLDNRLGLDLTYYDKETSNQILTADISRASGFTNQVINAGVISNKGIEALLSATPVQLDNGFRWDVTVNYAHNRNRVEELYGNLQTVLLGPSHWFATIEARKGEPYGAIYGTRFKRDAQGRLLLRNGLPQATSTKHVLGHYPNDWMGGLTNTFRYRNLDLSVMLDTRQGGEIYSTGIMWGSYAGILKETEHRPIEGILVEGIDEATGQPNTTRVQTEKYFHSLYPIQERWIFDASFVKLREVRLGYDVPPTLTQRARLANLRVALVGRNLALWTDTPHIDPEAAFSTSNLQGIEMGQLPTARSIGFQLTVTP